MNEFLANWSQCNAVLGESPLVIARPGGPATNRAAFDNLATQLQNSQTLVQGRVNDLEIAREEISLQKAVLLQRLHEFNGLVEAYYQGTKFANARPLAPGMSEGQERFTNPMVDMMTLWERLNAGSQPPGVTLPLMLSGGMAQGNFASLVSQLQFAFRTERTAAQDLDLTRAERAAFQQEAYELMKAYRVTVPARLALYPSIVAVMPKLTPEPGHTPAPVQASGVLVPPNVSQVTHTASSDPDLSHYELEGTNGAVWREEDAVHLASHAPGAPNDFSVQFGLTQPGTAVTLKVFVVTTTGNRAGSAAVVVLRP